MKRILFAIAALALLLPATAQVSKAADVSVNFFYDNLSGGDWVEVDDYGYCWQPSVAVSNTNWRPYSDGYWAYTDLGWTWVSYEDFGWATYHYGRWARISGHGWVWVPGRDEDLEWGPAWVSWRTGGDHIGWAPLPPSRVRIYEGRAITGHVDIEFDIGPSYYNFVDVRYIGEPVLRERIIDVNQNVTYINQTVNVTNITYKNKVVYNYGPDINVLNARASRPIQRLKLERQDNVDASVALKSGALTKVQGDKLVVAAPMRITKSTQQGAPPKVKTKIEKGKVDKGWAGVSDPNVKTQMQQKMKTEDAKQAQIGAGAGAGAGAAAGASPAASASADATVSAAAGTSPAPLEKGKGKHKNKFEQNAGAAAAAGASPAGAASPAEAASPAGAASPAAATIQEGRGKHKGKHADQFQPGAQATGGANAGAGATASPAGAPTGAPEGMSQRGGGKHKGKALEQATPPQVQGQPGDLSGDQGEGNRKARRLERKQLQPGAQPPTGGAELQGQGVVGKPPSERALGKPAGAPPPAGVAAEGQGQGKRGGGKKQKAEEAASPVPVPSP